jgi:hypothetical protein
LHKAELLLKTAQIWVQTKAHLCRLHAVYDGPVTYAAALLVLLVNDQSAVDSMEGDVLRSCWLPSNVLQPVLNEL